MRVVTLSLLGLFLVTPVFAEPASPRLPEGQTYITLSATEQKDIVQDQLQASLRIEVEDRDAKKVQDKINEAMKKAVSAAKDVPDVKVSTGQYYVYSYDPSPVPPTPMTLEEGNKRLIWKGTQTLDLLSKDSQKLLDLSGKVQAMGFMMNGLNYILSNEKSEAQKDELLTSALLTIKNRAALIAKTLDKKGYDIVELTVDNAGFGGGQPPMPMMAMRGVASDGMAEAKMAAPVAEPGQSQVSLTVTARVLLKP
ncbi:MAG: SIMPL domain-containing protein [Alphaproteobacteria bacterium]|nr:SIMPL domain-containing protein [Alphaproteobacteria bacterium]